NGSHADRYSRSRDAPWQHVGSDAKRHFDSGAGSSVDKSIEARSDRILFGCDFPTVSGAKVIIMKSDRREFLKSSCKALSMVAAATQLRHFGAVSVLAQKAVEASPEVEYKALVCVFLAGGSDSNNVVI